MLPLVSLRTAFVVVLASAAVGAGLHSVKAGDAKVTVLQLVLNGSDPDLTLELPESVAILADPPSDPPQLAREYRSAIATSNAAGHFVDSSRRWMIVAGGPLLDSPDEVEAQVQLDGHNFRISAVYTSTRLQGGGLRRNAPWRPLLKVPVDPALTPGDYQVQVSWQPLESLPNGKPLDSVHYASPLFFTMQP